MIRGTTPLLHFDLPFSTSLIKSAEITIEYEDANKAIEIVKTMKELFLRLIRFYQKHISPSEC